MYSVLDVSKYILGYCNNKEYMVSNLWLQKVLYFVQAYFLLEKKAPCFQEKIEAWDFGPVVPEAYREYKRFGGAPIPYFKQEGIVAAEDRSLINSVVDIFTEYSASELTDLTMDQLPWQNAYFPYRHNRITNQAILSYFS